MDDPPQVMAVPRSPSRQKLAPAPEKTALKAGPISTTSVGKKEKKAASGQVTGVEAGSVTEPGKEKIKEGKEKKPKDEMTIDDLLLPRTLISRLSRGSLPPNTSLQKDALLALTKSATVFISYLAHTANSLTSRKTIQADDILKAISEMELDSVMRERLEKEIQLFEEGVRGKRKGYRDRVKARESGFSQADGTEIDETTGEHVHKRVKRSAGDDDVDMDGVSDSARHAISTGSAHANEDVDDDDYDDPSAQLLAEASRAADREDADETTSERDEDDEDDAVDNEDEEDEDEDENDEADKHDADEEGVEIHEQKKSRQYLAPDGRAEVGGSDDESD